MSGIPVGLAETPGTAVTSNMEESQTSITTAASFEGLVTSVFVPESSCPKLTASNSSEGQRRIAPGTNFIGGPDPKSPMNLMAFGFGAEADQTGIVELGPTLLAPFFGYGN